MITRRTALSLPAALVAGLAVGTAAAKEKEPLIVVVGFPIHIGENCEHAQMDTTYHRDPHDWRHGNGGRVDVTTQIRMNGVTDPTDDLWHRLFRACYNGDRVTVTKGNSRISPSYSVLGVDCKHTKGGKLDLRIALLSEYWAYRDTRNPSHVHV